MTWIEGRYEKGREDKGKKKKENKEEKPRETYTGIYMALKPYIQLFSRVFFFHALEEHTRYEA